MREYQDEHVGALDGEDIEGFVGEESPLFQQVLEQSRKQLEEDSEDERTRIINWIKDMQERRGDQKEEKDEVRRNIISWTEVSLQLLRLSVSGMKYHI